MPEHIYGLWQAKIVEGRWCVGKAGSLETQSDAAMVFNTHHRFSDGILAMTVASTLSRLPLLPPPYEDAPAE